MEKEQDNTTIDTQLTRKYVEHICFDILLSLQESHYKAY